MQSRHPVHFGHRLGRLAVAIPYQGAAQHKHADRVRRFRVSGKIRGYTQRYPIVIRRDRPNAGHTNNEALPPKITATEGQRI